MSVGSSDTIAFTRSNSPALIASMKAALLDVVSCIMPRFYPGAEVVVFFACAQFSRHRPTFLLASIALAILFAPAPAAGQPATLPEQPLLGTTFTSEMLHDLPTGHNAFTLLETIQTEAISNRFSLGSMNVATAPEIGGFLNSWNQTQYRVGDIAITDPRTGGTPLLLPLLPLWERITIATGAMGVEDNAPALSMTLDAPRPGTSWRRSIEGSLSAPPLVAASPGPAPAVDRVRHWQDVNVLVSGPITGRLGLAAAASWRGLSHVVESNPDTTRDGVAAGFAHLVFAASPRDEVRAIGWAQHVTTGDASDSALHVQSTWERRQPADLAWRLFGGYTERRRSMPVAPTLVVDSLTSDPVSDLFDSGAGSVRRWTLGARAARPAARWMPSVGVELDGAQMRVAPIGLTQIREMVDGVPARIWAVHAGSGDDRRQRLTLAAHANEHIVWRRLTLDAGLRFETVHADAHDASRGIRWTSWLPGAMLRVQITNRYGLAAVAGVRRAAYQLPLNILAVGAPAAPVADLSRWNGTSIGPLIARVGPGTGGDAALTQIDLQLERPTTDELVLALVSHPRPGVDLEIARVTKRERPLLDFVDTGIAAAEYTPVLVPDPSFIPGSPVGAPQVTAYSRPPNSYGRDRYLLTNLAGDQADSWGLQAIIRVTTERLTFLSGLALTWARGPAAAPGFLPTENDQDVLGNLFVDRNADTAARGQLFQDRSHVGKIAVSYRLPADLRVGGVVRYQDGQPFSRLVIAPDLTQGPTMIRSYANGGSAFTFTVTLDVRVQKVFTIGRTSVAAMLDVYNLPNLDEEVSEYVVTGARFRTPTALQPPRTAVAAVRVAF
jgi:hypothetical protein